MSLKRLVKTQEEIRKKIILKDYFPKNIKRIGGVDQAFLNKDRIISAIVVCDSRMNVLEKKYTITKVKFPYIPGFLSFREGPPIIKTFRALEEQPDLLLVDGNGILHPRGIGIASYVGVLLNIVTIGIAKNLLCGETTEPKKVGEHYPVIYKGKAIGYAYKSKKNCKPIFISPGNKISLESSSEVVKRFIVKYKLPVPLQLAHAYANELRRKLS